MSPPKFLNNRTPVVLIGPRRFGKTSFILNLLNKYDTQSKPYLYIDIFNITSHKDFLHQVLRGLKSKKSLGNKIKAMFQAIPRIRPNITTQVDSNTGQPSFDLSFNLATSSEKDVKELIQDVLSGLENLGKGLLFVIDEFQKISEIGDNGWLEATLRTHMQQLRNTSFLFTGSRRSVISEMLNNPNRPLFRFCQPIEFPAFGDDFTSWIIERFKGVGIHCETVAVTHLRKLVQDTPNYVQMVCFHLVATGVDRITIEEVDKALNIVVSQNAYAYQTLLASLTPTQQRTLRLAASEGKQIFAKENLEKYEISSSPALSSAIKSLKDKEILDEEGAGRGTVIFDDPLFAIWLRIEFND
ncbi:MAG: ATP-binding protein [Chlamydiia bacterium]|nr:ATP-binding protein [Chlamydiia bacterium]